MKVSGPGLYDLPNEAYHADVAPGPSLSSSGAVTIMRHCPARFWWESYLNPARPAEEPSPNRDAGAAAHVAMLEPDLWASKVVVVEAEDWRGKAAREARDDAHSRGRIPILRETAVKIAQMRIAIDAHPVASGAFRGGRAEASAIWRDAATGAWLKARPDYLPDHRRYLVDYKTVGNAHPRAVERHVYDMGYHQQAPWHLDGVEAVTGDRPGEYWYVCQERDPPYLVSVCRLAGDALEWGAKLNRRAIDLFAECVASGEWPGYRDPERPDVDRAFDIGLPPYAAFQLAEREEAGELRTRRPSRALLAAAMAAQAPLTMED